MSESRISSGRDLLITAVANERDIIRSDPERAGTVTVRDYWSGEQAPVSRHFSARLGWSAEKLYVRFDAAASEPLVVNACPKLGAKTIGLWERDVFEIFVAADANEPRKYFEFEVAPTGEWLDVAIDSTGGERVSDWEYRSGMEASARVEHGRIFASIAVPWDAFGRRPHQGDVWLGNIFRCVGAEQGRGFLAWRPTFTAKPDFHVPEHFGRLIFG